MPIPDPTKTILVVEDDEFFATSIELALSWLTQTSIVLTSSAEKALEVLHDHSRSVNAVLTDINLPGMTGYRLIADIRGDERYCRLPILVISGDADPQAPIRARGHGADAFFSKPFSTAEMRLKLEELLDADRIAGAG